MTAPASDLRSPQQRARDERIASEPPLPPPDLPPGEMASPVEIHLASRRRPLAVRAWWRTVWYARWTPP